MAHPELVRVCWASGGGRDEVSPEVKEALEEIGFLGSLPRPCAVPQPRADKVVVVTRADARETVGAAMADEWKIPPPSPSRADLRQFRDVLRRRVWRMVAREGWYRLQPRLTAVGQLRRAASVAARHAH
jgi:hypothetical protein